MTVSSQVNSVPYLGDGVTTLLPVPYYFLEQDHLTVTRVNLDTTTQTLVLGSDYSVAGAGNQAGGSVTMFVAPASGVQIIIDRTVPATQETDYVANDPFPAESHERALDKLTMLVQQNIAGLGRALLKPVGKNYYDAEGRQIKNVADPTDDQDAATLRWATDFIASILATGQGPINNSANVIFTGANGFIGVVQDLADKLNVLKGSRMLGHDGWTVGDRLSNLKFPQQFPSLKAWAASGGGLGLLPGTYVGTEGLFFPYGTSIKTFGKCVLDFSAANVAGNFPDMAAVQMGNGAHTLLPKSASNYGKGLNAITFVSPHGLAPGDLICIYNPTDYSYSSWRAEYRAGEFCRVLTVTSPTRVVLEQGLYASYLTAAVDVYKIDCGPVHLDGALEVIAPETLVNVAAVKARRLVDFDLSNLKAISKKTVGALILDQCVSGRAVGIHCVQRELTGTGNDYGCIPSNCQDLELEGYFVGSRHGLSTGGYSGVGAVNCRDIRAKGIASTSGEGGAPAIGLHGNTEHFTWDGTIYGGYNGCGNFNKISGKIYPMPNGVAISHTELTGYDHDYSGVRIYPGLADPFAAPTFRGVFDLGGNNEAAAPDTLGGFLNLAGMVIDAPLATRGIMVTNRNASALDIRASVEGARILRGAAGYESVRFNHVTGSLPGAAGVAINRVDMRGFDAAGDPSQTHAELTTTGIEIGGFVDITLLTTQPTTSATVPLPSGWFKDAPIPEVSHNTNFVGSVKPIVSVVASTVSLTISLSTPNGSNFTAANVVRVYWTARTAR